MRTTQWLLTLSLSIGLQCHAQDVNILMQNTLGQQNLRLGQGFDMFDSHGKSQCIDPDVGYTYVGGSNAELSVFSDLSYSQILEKLNLETQLEGGYEGFGGDANVVYAKEAASSERSLSVNYLYQAASYPIQLKSTQTYHDIHPYIQKNGDKFLVSDEIYNICGNQYVSQLDIGASLRFNMQYQFNDVKSKDEIKSTLNGQYLSIIKIKNALNKLSEHSQKNTRVSIYVQQIGGDVSELTSWLGTEYAQCSIKEVDYCLKVLENFFKYQREVFPKQLQHDAQGHPAGYNWAVTSVHFTPFKDRLITYAGDDNPMKHGLLLTSSKDRETSAAVVDMRQKLIDKYNEQIETLQAVRSALALSNRSDEASQSLNQVKSIVTQNARQIRAAGNVCYQTPEACINRGQTAFSGLKVYDAEPGSLIQTVHQGELFRLNAINAWNLDNAAFSPSTSQQRGYLYLPDFGDTAAVQQKLSLEANGEYEFQADFSAMPLANRHKPIIRFRLVQAKTNKILAEQVIQNTGEHMHANISYHSKDKHEDAWLELKTESAWIKLYKVSNKQWRV